MGRGQSIELSIVHIDVEIGREKRARAEALDPFQGSIEMGVGRMRTEAHGIDDQHLDARA